MPKLKRFRMRRTQLVNKSKADVSYSVACMCADISAIVAANEVRLRSSEINMDFIGVASSVASIVKHKMQNVCTWNKSDLKDIHTEGSKLFGDGPLCQKMVGSYGALHFSHWISGQHTIFNKMCNVAVEQTPNVKKSELYERVQEIFFTYESCLLSINGESCAIMKHNDYYVVVDCNVRNSSGLGSDIGTSVIIFNTNWQDLFLHINALMVSLSADTLNICGVKVDVMESEMSGSDNSNVETSACPAKNVEESSMFSSNERKSVRGSFHQGDFKFRWPGKQCVAVSLAAMAMHKAHSVFSWESSDLDNVVNLGDGLYSYLRQSGSITDPTKDKLLCIPDLPQEYVFKTNPFKFEYGECVSGCVDEVNAEFIRSGACVTLADGLQSMFDKYDTCFFTLNGNTCAIIKQNTQFAVVDSHARSSSGMIDGNGFSVVVYHKTLSGVMRHILNLAACMSRHLKVFEITGVCVQQSKITNPCHSQAKISSVKTETRNCVGKRRRIQSLPVILEENLESKDVKKQKYHCKERREIIESVSKCNANADVICLGDRPNTMFNFTPMCLEMKKKLCSKLHVDFQGENSPLLTDTGPMGSPCKTESIVGDGNCFFRAVAEVICGTQKAHRALRLAIVKHMELHSSEYKNLLRSQYTSMEDYVSSSKMRYVGTWATEVEIQSASNYLGVDIFTFHHDKWLKYACMYEKMCNQGIYLQHSNENHYEVVVCVKQFENHNCYQLCQNKKDDGKCVRTRQSIKTQSEVSVKNETPGFVGEDTKKDAFVNNTSYFKKYYKLKRVKSKVKQDNRCKYHINTELQQHTKGVNRARYYSDVLYNESIKQASKFKYHHNVQHKRKVKEYSRLKYCNDVPHKNKVKEYSRLKYCNDVPHKNKVKEYSRLKYCNDVPHKNKVKEYSRLKYCNDVSQKNKVKEHSRLKYCNDVPHKNKVKEHSRLKYRNDVPHKNKVKEYSRLKYCNDVPHKNKVKEYSRLKYRNDVPHKNKVKEYSRLKYCNDALHKIKVKEYNRKKYSINEKYRKTIKENTKRKYSNNPLYKDKVKKHKLRKGQLKEKQKLFDCIKKNFEQKVNSDLGFVCCVCHRLLFREQVLRCQRDHYNQNLNTISLAKKCITEDFLHKCNNKCVLPCELTKSCKGQLWICFTCNSKLKRGEMPAESVVNNLELTPIPEQLCSLNSLEQHLIALHIPFMKMLALPKGGQNGIHGPITCVPSNVKQTTNALPRTSSEGSLVCIKLKRKLTYKGHYKYQYVDTNNIKQALCYLKKYNKYYSDVEFNEDWLNEFHRQDNTDDDKSNTEETDMENVNVDDQLHDRQQHCVFMDTCLQPVDIGQEVLDQYFDSILNIAPAEGNNPVKLLADETNEAKCFPVLFPNGSPTYHDKRAQRLTLSRYFNNRILNADGRFAKNIEYIFFAQYLSEVQQVLSNVSIALRKGHGSYNAISNDMFKDTNSIKKILNFDEGYKFLKPIRGTPAFWQGVQKDLFAMVRQLGIPTWFCSFSSADMRWTNLMSSILKQEGRKETLEQLEWADKCAILRNNPVTAARIFDFRWHCFLKEVLMSPLQPIGEIVDYFYRVEFQQRGSPHVHCLFWIKNAPQIDKQSDEDVVEFIDRYVTCEVPTENEELHSIVTSVQLHSKHHSKTCKKKNTVCRFNFPKPPSLRTFICRRKAEDVSEKDVCNKEVSSDNCQNDNKEIVNVCTSSNIKNKINVQYAQDIMTAVKKAVLDQNINSVEDLFDNLGINQDLFELAYKCLNNNTHIVLKRQLNDVWVNQYNKFALQCWNANMDIQYVTDAYACIVYIISYISKSEREMGLLLGNTQREATTQGNTDARQALRKLGSVYLHNREVSAQEAVYRLTNMHLKECSRHVQFIPTGEDTVRMSLPLSVIQNKLDSENVKSEDIWMTSYVDRYKNRPNQNIFEDMCLATFASEYRIAYHGTSSPNKIKLNHNFGFIIKRTRTQPAIVRFARFSVTKNPEKFYQSLLQLFLPYRVDSQLKPVGFSHFEQFYREGKIYFSDGSVHLVHIIVNTNRALFEKDADMLDTAQRDVDNDGILENAWCLLCPEQQLEHFKCAQLRRESVEQIDENESCIPDLAFDSEPLPQLEKKDTLSRVDGLSLIRSLNKTQMVIFNKIRQWCLDKIRGEKPKPFHIFITGGAGTGKSHLIKAIKYEATRLLSQISLHPDDICVLLTAPTGIASFQLKASTIHQTFSIGTDVKLPYTPLGEEKLNSLRAKFHGLHILIIDEISMVDHKLLAYIHGRLRQIKQTGDSGIFGNVVVIAVGDFFQLAPVKGKPLFVDVPGLDLWINYFSVVELTQIVRQQDTTFAQLLNRLRKRNRKTPLRKEDLEILSNCDTGEANYESLHIFATNDEVHEHNLELLIKTCEEIETIKAEDFARSKKTGKLELLDGHHVKVYNTCLTAKLLLGVNARVMLMKNIDINDGLVNGVCGTVTHITRSNENKLPEAVYVRFDDYNNVGVNRRKLCLSEPARLFHSTPIYAEEETVCRKGGLRRQFPLKLAWACTVHKVQGLTVDSAVVSLKKVFAPGQAYVALSRVRNLSGLTIKDFNEKKIYCNEKVFEAINEMPCFIVHDNMHLTEQNNYFSVFLLNVQSLRCHKQDLMVCVQQLQPTCVGLTETWLPEYYQSDNVHMNNYTFVGLSRSAAYTSNCPLFNDLKAQQHGGVGLYTVCGVKSTTITFPNLNLECLLTHFVQNDILLCVVYRPQTYTLSIFKDNLSKLINLMSPICSKIILIGDFNNDAFKSKSLCSFMLDNGFIQLVKKATTEKGTLIDHVYVKNIEQCSVNTNVVPVYFSTHEGVLCSFHGLCV